MTKVILHGGYPSHQNSQNDKFFQEILKGLPEEVNVLFVYFAKEEKDYEDKFEKEKAQFLKNAGTKKLNIKLASKEDFIEGVKKSEVVYISGGKSLKLLDALKEYPEFKDIIKGKVVTGESAGINVLSKYFYTKTGGVFEGLGLLPIRAYPHYNDNQQVIEELDKYPKDLELVLLRDYETKTFFIK